jgi:hypothetical protein
MSDYGPEVSEKHTILDMVLSLSGGFAISTAIFTFVSWIWLVNTLKPENELNPTISTFLAFAVLTLAILFVLVVHTAYAGNKLYMFTAAGFFCFYLIAIMGMLVLNSPRDFMSLFFPKSARGGEAFATFLISGCVIFGWTLLSQKTIHNPWSAMKTLGTFVAIMFISTTIILFSSAVVPTAISQGLLPYVVSFVLAVILTAIAQIVLPRRWSRKRGRIEIPEEYGR